MPIHKIHTGPLCVFNNNLKIALNEQDLLIMLGGLLGSARYSGDISTLQLSDPGFYLCSVFNSHVCTAHLTQCVNPANKYFVTR